MKKLFFLLFICLFITSFLVAVTFNPALKWAQKEVIKKGVVTKSVSDNYSVFYNESTNEITYNVIMKLDNVNSLSKVDIAGVDIQTILSSGILTARVANYALNELKEVEEIEYVELSSKKHARMDVSRPEIGVDNIHAGTGLQQSYNGEEVIVGVLDTGIDFDHADFKNNDGTTRILYIWDQENNGNPPQGYDYGTEWTETQINNGQCTEIDDGSHGTHVAGTAVGNGNADNSFGDYTGISPESNIIIIKGMNNAIDGANYVFTKTQALGKPAVINMSIGGHDGPHDGTSLYEQGLTELVGDGKIIVAAAGNEGTQNIHLSYSVTYDGAASLFQAHPGNEAIIFDIWYSSDYQMDVAIEQLDGSLQSLEFTGWIAPGQEYEESFSTGQNVGIDATEVNNPHNGDRHIQMGVQGDGLESYYWGLNFSAHDSGESATFDCWLAVDGAGAFIEAPDYIAGDNLKTVGSPATSNNVFAIGAYNTKNTWIDVNGQTHNEDFTVGERANFSSIGPTRDGRVVPQICAPGNLIASALTEDTPYADARIIQGGFYQLMEGTSMATPHMTGVIALMLEADPSMGFDEILATLALTAREDNDTSSNGELPNNYWGFGKVDAYEAVSFSETSANDDVLEVMGAVLGNNYPNPFNPETEIAFSILTEQDVELMIYNVKGQKVKTLLNSSVTKGDHSVKWMGEDETGNTVSSGIYFYQLKTDSFSSIKKCVLLK